jgi:hypothetical protein
LGLLSRCCGAGVLLAHCLGCTKGLGVNGSAGRPGSPREFIFLAEESHPWGFQTPRSRVRVDLITKSEVFEARCWITNQFFVVLFGDISPRPLLLRPFLYTINARKRTRQTMPSYLQGLEGPAAQLHAHPPPPPYHATTTTPPPAPPSPPPPPPPPPPPRTTSPHHHDHHHHHHPASNHTTPPPPHHHPTTSGTNTNATTITTTPPPPPPPPHHTPGTPELAPAVDPGVPRGTPAGTAGGSPGFTPGSTRGRQGGLLGGGTAVGTLGGTLGDPRQP